MLAVRCGVAQDVEPLGQLILAGRIRACAAACGLGSLSLGIVRCSVYHEDWRPARPRARRVRSGTTSANAREALVVIRLSLADTTPKTETHTQSANRRGVHTLTRHASGIQSHVCISSSPPLSVSSVYTARRRDTHTHTLCSLLRRLGSSSAPGGHIPPARTVPGGVSSQLTLSQVGISPQLAQSQAACPPSL